MNQVITLKLSKVLAIIVSTGVILAAAQVLYWSAQPSTVLTVNNSPVPVKPLEVSDNNKVYLTVDFCKNINATGVTTLNLIGESAGAKIALSWPIENTSKQCAVFSDIPVPVPAQTPSDTYHAEFITCYTLNPLKHSCTTFISKSFKVTNSKLSPGDAKVQ